MTRPERPDTLIRKVGLLLALASPLWLAGAMSALAAEEPKPAPKETQAGNPAPDRIVLRSGRIVDGKILDETETQITMNVVMNGITAKTTFLKTEVLEIKRGVNTSAPPTVAVKSPQPDPIKKKEVPAKEDKEPDSAANEDDPDLTRLYLVEIEGRFGFDVSKTALANLFKEADKELADTIPAPGDSDRTIVDPAKRDRNIIVIKMNTGSQPGDNTIFAAEDLAPVVKEQIVDRGRRVVFWIELAAGGAAILPFVSPDIYFTPEGRLGGIADLDKFNIGDHMVDEKQISLRIGHAEGFLIKGGYGEHIPALHAMLRKQYWLFVRFEGGKPIYLEKEPDEGDPHEWVLLSDDGEGENADEAALIGNDMFLLEPDWAEKLGISDGTAETIDDLAFRLGVQRHYKAIEKNRGQKALDAWKTGIDDAIKNVLPEETETTRRGKLWREYDDIPPGGDFTERKRSRGRKINILRQIRAIVAQYAEVLDPGGTYRAEIDVEISKLKLEAEVDARQNRPQGGAGRDGG